MKEIEFQALNYFSRVLRDSTPRFVGLSVRWLVGWSVPFLLGVFKLFGLTTFSQMLL